MAPLVWLHLSDLHRGARGERRDWPTVQDALKRDLERVAKALAPPDLLLFTGDLTYSGTEYEAVEEVLDWLDRALGRQIPVFAVPGNHDLARPKAKREWSWLYGDDEETAAEREAAISEDPATIAALFPGWQDFAHRRLHPRLPDLRPGLLPGDAAWTFQKGDLRLGLLGLNSAWRQYSGADFQGRVSVSPHQLHALLPDGAAAFKDRHHAVLMLQHHPPGWLADRSGWEGRVESAAHALLFGHMHESRATVSREESNYGRPHVQARSLCGLERYGRRDEDRRFGYRWGALELKDLGEEGLCSVIRTGARTLVEGKRWRFAHPADADYPEWIGMKMEPLPVPPALRPPPQGLHLEVVVVRAELGEVAEAVAGRLRHLPGVEAVRVVEPGGGEPAADLRLLLLGGRTGGSDAFAHALENGAPALKTSQLDPERLDLAELPAAMVLRARIPHAFTGPEDAAEQALGLVGEWLRARQPTGGPSPVLEAWERDYLAHRRPAWWQGRHSGLAVLAGQDRLDRAALYVPLKATTHLAFADAEGEVHVQKEERPEREARPDPMGDPTTRRPVALERALCEPELSICVVHGEPGGGKTVLLQHLATVLAAWHLSQAPPAHLLDLDRLAPVATGGPRLPMPIWIEASALDAALCRGDGLSGLVRALAAELEAATGEAPDLSRLRAGLVAGRYLVLVDALDEVPGREARQRVVQCLAGLRAQPGFHGRVVLTTRPAAYTAVSFGDLPVLEVAELDDETANAVMARWCAAHSHDAPYLADLSAAVFEASRRHRGAQFAKNPMLLTAAMLVYGRQLALPDSTATLYQELVAVLCLARKTSWPVEEAGLLDQNLKRQALERVFWRMQEAGGTELDVDDAANALRDWQPRRVPDTRAGQVLLDRLANDTGLLRFEDRAALRGRRGGRVVRPWHRSFQEYLAASHLAAREGSVEEVVRGLINGGKATDPAWEGVLRFAVGVHGSRGSERAQAWVAALYEGAKAPGAMRPGRLWGLVAAALGEYREHFDGFGLNAVVPGELIAAFEQHNPCDGEAGWPLLDRLLALDAVGVLGDPRLGEPRGDEAIWVEVPGGRFTFGADQKAYNVAPPAEAEVPTFRVAWRPVTVQDYAPFVPHHQPPEDWPTQLFHPSRPVVGVDWADAAAFCAWATREWRHPKGWVVRLPSEVEWEYLAAGAEGRIYPWGSKPEPGEGDEARANYGALLREVGHPSPVGMFPRGHRRGLARPVVDLAGNVWEWCADPWEGRPDVANWRQLVAIDASPAAPDRVVRGGAWNYESRILRCAFRLWIPSEVRSVDLGFRVVCVPPPEPR